MPMFTVAKDDVAPQYQALPQAAYQGDVHFTELTGPGMSASSPTWQAIRGYVDALTTPEGDEMMQHGTKTVNLSGKQRRFQITVAADNPEAIRIGGEQIAKLAWALGIAQEGENGTYAAPGETLEEVFDNLSAANGSRVNFWLKVGPRVRKGVVQTRPGTEEPFIDEEPTNFRPLTTE